MAWYNKKTTWLVLIGAFVLWIYVSLNDTYQMIIDVPLMITSPKGKAVEDVLPSYVSVDVVGAGWGLLNYMYFSSSKICKVNLNKVKQEDSFYIITNVDLLKGIEGLNKIQARRFYPDGMKVKTSEIITKEVEIKPDIQLNLSNDFVMVGDIKTTPTDVIITGNKKLLDNINSWKTQQIEINNVTKSFAYTINVDDSLASILTINPKTITIYGSVEQYSEKTFDDVELQIIGGVVADNELIFPRLFSITVNGGVDLLNKLTTSDVKISINYDDIVNDTTGVLLPKITLPPYVKLVTTSPKFIIHRNKIINF